MENSQLLELFRFEADFVDYDAIMDEYLKQKETAVDFNEMMAKMIPNANKVIVLLTPKYKERADQFIGGVGDEYRIILEEIKTCPNAIINLL